MFERGKKMKIEKRLVACLLAIVMVITAIPDRNLWAEESATETEDEWLVFESDGNNTVTIEEGSTLKNTLNGNVEIYYKVCGSDETATATDLVNNGHHYNDKEQIQIETAQHVEAVAVFERQFDINPDSDSYDP